MLYQFGRFELDTEEHRLTLDGVPATLEPKTLLLLGHLASHPGKLLRKQALLDAIWPDTAVTENALTRSITLLRRTLEDSSRDPRFIETVPKVGYRFIAEVRSRPALAPIQPEVPVAPISIEPASAAVSVTTETTTETGPARSAEETSGTRRRWRRPAFAASSLAVLLVSGVLVQHRVRPATTAARTFADRSSSAAEVGSGPAVSTANREAASEEIRRGLFFYDRRNGKASEAAFAMP